MPPPCPNIKTEPVPENSTGCDKSRNQPAAEPSNGDATKGDDTTDPLLGDVSSYLRGQVSQLLQIF